MIQLTIAAKLTNAINKARTVKPHVRINCFGSYDATNKATGATYNVVCLKREGKRFAHYTFQSWSARTSLLSRRGCCRCSRPTRR